MCQIFKDKNLFSTYLLGILGGIVGYLIGKAIVTRYIDILELLAFLLIFALLYGISLEIISRRK